MVEALDQLSQLAKERAESLERSSVAFAGEAEGLLLMASDSANFARFLSVVWAVLQMRLRKGGVPAKRVVQECDMLLEVMAGLRNRLSLISKVWQERQLPTDVAEPLYREVQEARILLDSVDKHIRGTRDHAATPPRVSADPDQLKQRIRQADEGAEWLKLADVVARMRQGSSGKQE